MKSFVTSVDAYFREILSFWQIMLQSQVVTQIATMTELIVQSCKRGATVYIFGNGGSAATAEHFAAEFMGNNLPRVISLTVPSSTITAIGNDYHFEEIYSRQVDLVVSKGDLTIGISTSGQSLNVLLGLQRAHEKGSNTILLTGQKEVQGIDEFVDLVVSVPSQNVYRVQEAHLTILHLVFLEMVRRYRDAE